MKKDVSGNLKDLIVEKQKFRMKLFAFFIFLIYIPVSINLYNVYIKTVELTKNDVINIVNSSVNRTSITVEVYLKHIFDKISETSQLTSLRKVISDRNTMTNIVVERSDAFFTGEFYKIKDKYIEGIFCINKNNELVYVSTEDEKIGDFIKDSVWYKDFMNSSDRDIVIHKASQGASNNFVVIKKLMGTTFNMGIRDSDDIIGSIVFIVSPSVWDTLNSVGENDKLSIYYDGEVVLGEDILAENNLDFSLKDDKYIFLRDKSGVEKILTSKFIKAYDMTLISYTSTDKYFHPIINSVKNSILMILVIGLIVIIGFLIEMMVISKLTTDKQMSQLRLLASEEANQRFSIFKHDMLNHIQIIQGLIHMQQYEKALEYSQSLTNESRLLVNRWRIGIPELESAIFQSLIGLKDSKIELKFDFCTLPQDIPVKIYDLTKIIVNLIKNAKFALEESENAYKSLGIKIYEGIGEYVFEITNNVPLIPEDMRTIIFEKGYTTKGSKGNGLGLHIVKTLTEKNGGTMELRVDEAGNHFIVRFPN